MDGPLGRFVVIDPKICHGAPTFRGTRILVADVLDQLAEGLDWDAITESWGGATLTRDAIGEALRLARGPMFTHLEDLILGPSAVAPT